MALAKLTLRVKPQTCTTLEMSDSGGEHPFDALAFLSSLSEASVGDGAPVVFIRSQQEQRAFVGRALDALQTVADIADDCAPLFSLAAQAITHIEEEARQKGFAILADVLTELMLSLLTLHADRSEHEGERGRVLEGRTPNAPGIEKTADGMRRKWEPKHSPAALRDIHHNMFWANQLLLEIYLTGTVRFASTKPGA